MRDMLSVEEYLAELLALVEPDARTEKVPLLDAAGQVLAKAVRSPVSIPVFANSAMDGYAVRHAEVSSAPARLRVVADIAAGSAADPEVGPGQCVRIMTGAPLPTFADTVVPVEDTVVPVEDTDDGIGTVEVRRAPARIGAHVRLAGEDVAAGTLIAPAGAELTPALMGALAAVGVIEAEVRPRPVVAVCATGDELVTDGSVLQRGQIYESNSVLLTAALARDGAQALRGQPVGDRAEELVAWLAATAPHVDLVILTGGASVGAFDVVRDVLTDRAGGVFRHVRMQPGKPQGWGVWPNDPSRASGNGAPAEALAPPTQHGTPTGGASSSVGGTPIEGASSSVGGTPAGGDPSSVGGTPVVALPGNPVSASLSYEVFVRPMLDRILGRPASPPSTAVAGVGWSSPAGRRQLLPVRLRTDRDGRLLATPAHARGSASHMVTSLAGADGFAVVAEEITEVREGEPVGVRWLR